MKKYILPLVFLLTISCSEEGKTEEGKEESTKETEKEEPVVEESYDLSIDNFVTEDSASSTFDLLPYEFLDFEPTHASAYWDDKYKILSIIYSNFENPEITSGRCCENTGNADHRLVSFVIIHDRETGELDLGDSYIHYSTEDKYQGLNQVDNTMSGNFDMHDNYVEGTLTYSDDLDSTAIIKTTFKLNLERGE